MPACCCPARLLSPPVVTPAKLPAFVLRCCSSCPIMLQPAALRRRPLRRRATPRHSDSTRCHGRSLPAAAQPPVPRGSAAAHSGSEWPLVAALIEPSAPPENNATRAARRDHTTQGRAQVLWEGAGRVSRPAAPAAGSHCGGLAASYRTARLKIYQAPWYIKQRVKTEDLFEDATRRIFAFLAHRRRSQENRKTWLRRIFPRGQNGCETAQIWGGA